ncbi:MAG: sulfite exporter TauE/SafE family protein [Candidatus Lokiarchaeia archaeon]
MDWWLLYFLLSGGSEGWLYPLMGGVTVFTGIIAAMLGVGGGFLNVPIINYIANEPINVAIGTSLFIIVFTSFSATIGYARKRVIDFKLGLVLETASIPGAFLGAYLTGWISEIILKAIFGVALILIGINMIFRNRRQNPSDSQKALKKEKKSIKSGILNWKRVINVVDGESYEYYINVPLGLAFAFVAGVVSGLLGIGGGLVKVPLLNVALGVPMIITVATSMFMIIFTTLTGAFEHSMLGQVNWMIGGIMIIGAIIGAQIGCRVALKISPDLLRKIFGAGAIVLAIQMIYTALISL